MDERHFDEWEELARRKPYFSVLNSEGEDGVASSARPTEAFFETGESDVATLLQGITAMTRRELATSAALDFGCGAGRLTLPLARRFSRVTGCDVAPTILQHARVNAEIAGLHNVSLIGTDGLTGLPRAGFDFILSLLVFQYIPPAEGRPLIRNLLRLLTPGGVAALQFTLERRGTGLRRLARIGSRHSRKEADRGEKSSASGKPRHFLRIYEHNLRAIQGVVEAAGARIAGQFPSSFENKPGAVLIIERQ